MKRIKLIPVAFLFFLLSLFFVNSAIAQEQLSAEQLKQYLVMDAGSSYSCVKHGRTIEWLKSQHFTIEVKTLKPENVLWADANSGNQYGAHFNAPPLAPGTTVLVNEQNAHLVAIEWSACSLKGTNPEHQYQREGGLNIVYLQTPLNTAIRNTQTTQERASSVTRKNNNGQSTNEETFESNETIDGGHATAQIPIYLDRISGVQYSEDVKLAFARFLEANYPNFKLVGSKSRAKYSIQLIGGYKNRDNETRVDKKQATTNTIIRGGERVASIVFGRTRNRVDDDIYTIYRGTAGPILVDPRVQNPNNQVRKIEFGFTIRTIELASNEVFSEAYSAANFEFTYKQGRLINVSGDIPPDADLTNTNKIIELGTFNKALGEMLLVKNFTIKP